MIDTVKGIMTSRKEDRLTIQIGHIGVELRGPETSINSIGPIGSDVLMYTQLQVKDDSVVLYGFITAEEREFFRLLQSVSGIGPRIALGLLSVFPPHMLLEYIETEDSKSLTQVSGVGKRMAARLVIELKGKFPAMLPSMNHNLESRSSDPDLENALIALGYSDVEIREAILGISNNDDINTIEDRIRSALQLMGSSSKN